MPDKTFSESIVDICSLLAALTVLFSFPLACVAFCIRKKKWFFLQNSAILFFIVRGMCMGMPWLVPDNMFCPTITHGHGLIALIGVSVILVASWALLRREDWRRYAFSMLIFQACISTVVSVTVLNFQPGYVIVGTTLAIGLLILWCHEKDFLLKKLLR